MSQKNFQSVGERLRQNLKRLITEGAEGNFLVVSAGDVYVQFAAQRGDQDIYCEAISNRYLPKRLQLSDDQIAQLVTFGFAGPDYYNFSRIAPVPDEMALQELAHQTMQIFASVYDCDPRAKFEFQLILE